MVRPRNETEGLLLSIIKICERLNKQTHTKPQETLEFKLIKPWETFSFKPPISIEESGTIWLTSLKVNYSVFNKTEENIKFELYTDTFDEF